MDAMNPFSFTIQSCMFRNSHTPVLMLHVCVLETHLMKAQLELKHHVFLQEIIYMRLPLFSV